MTQIITPKDAIAVVLATKTKDFRLQLYETSTQKLSFLGSIVSIVLGTSRNPFFAAIRREVTHKCQVRGF